jgi:transcriptional regulator with XRE-family HTH domain
MPKPRTAARRWTASQVVAHNLTRARELRGLTQTQVAERLSRFTGTRWSQATVAQAEGSVGGQRIRQFTANELVGLARTFDLPILYFFLPPDDHDGRLATDDTKTGLPWEYLLVLLLGHRATFGVVADRAAGWTDVLAAGIDIPLSDPLPGDDSSLAELAGHRRHRQPVQPEDVLAAAFHGLAARRMRGSQQPGQDVATFAQNLRGLADALDAFNNYQPGAFVDDAVVDAIAQTPKAESGDTGQGATASQPSGHGRSTTSRGG